MAQALHLMNAPEIDAKIQHPEGRVARLIQSGRTDAEIIEELCLTALARPASVKELSAAKRLFTSAASRRDAAEDFLWTLLNSYDFIFVR